ncbi:MAG: YeeE/YedE family protein [SAR324 cluster bacterium]|nr:YeeE/YedE family protein [SAR324 cluster bacterium]
MVAPLFKLGYIGYPSMIVVGLLVGAVFGFILQSSGMGNSRKITAVFYGEDWAVMRVMFSAVVTGMVLTFLFYYLGLLDLNLVQLATFNLGGQIIGGLLLGAGMGIGGY